MAVSITLDLDKYEIPGENSAEKPVLPPLKAGIASFIEASSSRGVNVHFWLMEMLGNPDLNEAEQAAFADLKTRVEKILEKGTATKKKRGLEELLILKTRLSKFLELIIRRKIEEVFPSLGRGSKADEELAFKTAAGTVAEFALFAESDRDMIDSFNTQIVLLRGIVERIRARREDPCRISPENPNGEIPANIRGLLASALSFSETE